ncbi:CDP-glycerol glycerophosphotransferase family protein [Macrococcus lamae]|uniref:CDP-glycerol glycerophosphotransferase family protein n=1 Tax=Macrococcus lamae TaxID=198484 RepID=A0A4R6BVH9_9STAP|nr:CDP-glycerol glycerophosphotransferase family protein [Macrococcus lamae]TDM12408.1 hypothetical protein ERX29_03535 [Macrococcus lamae]
MRKIIKRLYLTLIKIIDICYRPSINKDIVMLMTFKEDQSELLINLLTEHKVTVIYHPKYEDFIKSLNQNHLKSIPLSNKYIIQQVFAIKNARIILIDTYYLLLGSITKSSKQEVIQLWHASSALKLFGLEDKSIDLTDMKSIEQYLKVYHFTDSYIVAGDKMVNIFKRSLDAYEKNFMLTGLPRLTVNEQSRKNNSILFLPTYREYDLDEDEKLHEDDIQHLIIKAHPSDRNYASTSELPTKELMLASDIIITDYSSLAVEAAYYNKKVVFYVPDEAKYNEQRGLNNEYYSLSKGRKAYTIDQLKNILKTASIPEISDWTNYQSDDACQKLINYIKEQIK